MVTSEIVTIGLDLAKSVFQGHGADGADRAVLHKKLRRAQVLEFCSQLPPCVVAMEACGDSGFWGREIGKLGHEVRLIPPVYVKPFVKRQKNEAVDAEPICEAVGLINMPIEAGAPQVPFCSLGQLRTELLNRRYTVD